MSLYHHRNNLKLESWDHNPYISPELKGFYIDIIEKIDYFDGLLYTYNSKMDDLRILEMYLDNKGTKNDFNNFRNFVIMKNNPSELEIKIYFRKEKIKKILNDDTI